MLGKVAYQVVKDVVSVKLRQVDSNHIEYHFRTFSELEEFIASEPDRISWVSMH